ncbi:MAG: hypothetical protein QM811_19180 [Pirellulales bacterium]
MSDATKQSRIVPVLWAILIIAIVGGIVAGGLYSQSPKSVEFQMIASTAPSLAQADHDYYVWVHLVEFKPKKPNGSNWDSGNNSAPDADVRLYWRGNRIFILPKREDQLIATWDLFRVDVMQLVNSGGKIDIEGAINAPIVRAGKNEPLTIEVWDSDLIGDDLALKMDVPIDNLYVGRNDITPPPSSGLVRLRVDLIDRTTPLPKLIELASGR